MIEAFGGTYRDRTVFVTGHTGFKGGWLCTWLKLLGARVTGFAQPPEPGRPSLFEMAAVGEGMRSVFGDIRDLDVLVEALQAAQPEIVFHLAAQPLVRRAYRHPVETFATNFMGTVHLLEATRRVASVRTVIVATSDKCYDIRDDTKVYRETDPIGGYDPYSASKGAAELAANAYRRSYFASQNGQPGFVGLASVRAGNVIGGGDWAEDRLIPDCIRALESRQAIPVRSSTAVRPWQFVLEPLAGYLWLAARMSAEPGILDGPWNFAPHADGHAPVREVVDCVIKEWGSGEIVDASQPGTMHEAPVLLLSSDKAAERLNWRCVLGLQEAVRETVDWYRRARATRGVGVTTLTNEAIERYRQHAQEAGLPWAQ